MNRCHGKKPMKSGFKNKEEAGEDKKNRVRSFLESLFRASTRGYIEVDIGSLKKFFEPNQLASKALQLTFEFKELSSRIMPKLDETSWEGWVCCYCHGCFPDHEDHFEHILDHHLKHPHLEELIAFSSEFAPSFPPEWAKKILDGCWKPIDTKLFTEGTSDRDVSLVLADTEREKLLASISVLFRTLLQRGILHISHLDAMLDYAMANLPSAEVLKMNGVDRSSLLCFRCLDAPPLEHVRDFLKNLLEACKSGPNAKENNSTEDDDDDDKILDPPDHDMRVVLDGSRLSVRIYADKWLVPSDNSNGNASYNLDAAAVISWLYDGPLLTIEDNAKSWFLSMSAASRRCQKLFKELLAKHKELCVLRRLDDRWMRYKRALQNVVLVQSFEEERRKANSTQLTTIQSPMDFLEGWKDQLPEDESNDFRTAFTKILKEAEDMEASECRGDNFITNALAKEKQELNMEFHRNAARVRKNIYDSQQMMGRIETISSFDFRIMVIALAKCFLRAKWEREAARAQGKRKREG